MKITLNPVIVYRVPRFAMTATLHDNWPELKAAIALSSPDFFRVIENIRAEDLDSLSPEIKQTIWKYFNRACFRATPYGNFAAIGTTILSGTTDPTLILAGSPVQHSLPDWTCSKEVAKDVKEVTARNGFLFSNHSYYLLGDKIRFLSLQEGTFRLAEIEAVPQLIPILDYCRQPVQAFSVLENFPDAEVYMEYLVGCQLLLTDQHPNIIGRDYFQRINAVPEPGHKQYVIAERSPIAGSVDVRHFRYLPALVEKLVTLNEYKEAADLKEFKQRFRKKFDARSVPVMEALDPETGIGYGGLEQDLSGDDFVFNLKPEETGKLLKDTLTAALLKQVFPGREEQPAYIDLEQLPGKENPARLSNTFSVLCAVEGDAVKVEHIGGCTANALLGRFSMVSAETGALCRELAGIEKQANPHVLFFDVAYVAEGYVDNINRRKSIYDYQLSILNYDTSAAPLTLDDLYLSLNGDDLVLRSKKLNRRLVPRIASAYNHRRSDLPLFRLLSDLQYQGLQTDLSFSPEALLPGLHYYPETRFRNIRLSARKWQLTHSMGTAGIDEFTLHLAERKICRFVRSGSADQLIQYDLEQETDRLMLLQELQKKRSLLIEESFIRDTVLMQDGSQAPYAAQLLLSMSHTDKIYNGAVGYEQEIDPGFPGIFLPGSEWLYQEIFCHPYRADQLLAGPVNDFLQRRRDRYVSWFFIRYAEGGEHIRLRLRLADPADSYRLVADLSGMLSNEISSGIVQDIAVKTYQRETERYGRENIERVEVHFCTDSAYALELAVTECSTTEKYLLCRELVRRVAASGFLPAEDLAALVVKLSGSFNKEHQWGTAAFKELNRQYQLLRMQTFRIPVSLDPLFEAMSLSFIDTLLLCPMQKRRRLFADLFHMHVNRVFRQGQRLHEGALYYFTWKEQLRERSLAGTGREQVS